MSKTIAWWVTCLAVLGLLVLPAQAGIIITEGKLADEQESSKEMDSSSSRRGVASEKSVDDAADEDDGVSSPVCTELDEDGFCAQAGTTVDEVSLKEVADLDTDDPVGWDCTPLGGGLEICEKSGGTGSSPGAGSGGGLGADVGLGAEVTVGGCQGGQAAPGWLALTLLWLVFMPRRRLAALLSRG